MNNIENNFNFEEFFDKLSFSLSKFVTNQSLIKLEKEKTENTKIIKFIREYNKLLDDLQELNDYSSELSKGNYSSIEPPEKTNYLASNLKELHSRLLNIMWQAKLIAGGDYRGKVAFDGDFAFLFNSMIERLDSRERMLKEEIEQRKSAEEEAMMKHNLLFTTLEGINIIVLVCDRNSGEILYSNHYARITILKDNNKMYPNMDEIQGIYSTDEIIEFYKESEKRWYSIRSNNVVWAYKQDAVIYMIEDITQRKNEQNELMFKASYDLLTGVYNRGTGTEILEEKLNAGESVCLVFIDMDNLKLINDTYGHQMGDRAIQILALAIGRCIRDNDVLVRLGGDEFMVIFSPCTKDHSIVAMARVQEKIEIIKKELEFPEDIAITFSYGVSTSNEENPKDSVELINNADELMYINKKKKKKSNK